MNLDHLKPGASVAALIAEIASAVTTCDRTNAALDRIIEDQAAAKLALDGLIAERATVLAQRARQGDTERVLAFQSRLDDLAKSVADAQSLLEGTTIAKAQLERELEDAEARVLALRTTGKSRTALGIYARDVADELYRRVEEVVVQHVLPLALEAAALNAAHVGADLSEWLNQLRIHKMGSTNSALLSSTEACFGGQQLAIHYAWREKTDLVARHEAVKAVCQDAAALDSYVPRRQRATAHYTPRGRTVITNPSGGAVLGGESSRAPEAAAGRNRVPTIEQALARPAVLRGTTEVPLRADMNIARHALADPDFEQFR